tara:strand:- start:56 stop:199 length:144 start_codon:yes stop_codon:yes gene_type:complete
MLDQLKTSIRQCFEDLPDPRLEAATIKLIDVIMIAASTVISNANNWQ